MTLSKKIEKIQSQQVDVRGLSKRSKQSLFHCSPRVILECSEYKLLVIAADKLIAKFRAEIAVLKQKLQSVKSVRSKLRISDLERENTELCRKIRNYKDVIQCNNRACKGFCGNSKSANLGEKPEWNFQP